MSDARKLIGRKSSLTEADYRYAIDLENETTKKIAKEKNKAKASKKTTKKK